MKLSSLLLAPEIRLPELAVKLMAIESIGKLLFDGHLSVNPTVLSEIPGNLIRGLLSAHMRKRPCESEMP